MINPMPHFINDLNVRDNMCKTLLRKSAGMAEETHKIMEEWEPRNVVPRNDEPTNDEPRNDDNKHKEEIPYKPEYLKVRIYGFLFIHIIALYGIYLILTDWDNVLFFIINYFTIGLFVNLGISMGVHRLWAHKAFKAHKSVKLALLVAQTLSGQNSVLMWVRDHRVHHRFSDTNADPHNAQRGFFFSHMGWLMMKKHPDVKTKGSTVDMSDLTSDPWIMFQYKNFIPLFIMANLAVTSFYLLIGCSYTKAIVLGFFVRYALTLHFTWTVNSIAHFYGNKPYSKDIRPGESVLVSFLTRGEGWHNYHHTFPWDYRASEFSDRVNSTCQIIDLLAKFGLVYDLKKATPDMIKNRVNKYGDGTHECYSVMDKKL